MLTMIVEEPEGGNTHHDGKDGTDSLSNMLQLKEENLTFPRRSRCRKNNTRKVDWVEMLAKAEEEDKKANIDITSSPKNSDSDDSENIPPPIPPSFINLSKNTPRRGIDNLVLDLSSVTRTSEARSTKKGYTLPTYEPQYRAQTHLMRSTPLKQLDSSSKSQSAQRLYHEKQGRNSDVAAKRALFHTNNVYYEREVVAHEHFMISQTHQGSDFPRAAGLQHFDNGMEVPHFGHVRVPGQYGIEGVREYGHSNTSGFHTQSSIGPNPSHPVQFQPIGAVSDNGETYRQQEIHSHPPQNNVFAVPEPPQRFKPSTKEIVVNGKAYQILALLGKGGSSKVYLVLAKDNSLLAIKCVNLGNVDEKTKMDHLNEIEHLMKMQYCKHIIKIIDHQYIPSRNLLYAVMERGDTDLSRLLKERMTSGEGVPPEMILFYWSEILLAVKSIHDNNIIHRDLKPANFLLVGGRLKLIDFGIASAIQSEQTSVFKDSQSGTPNYMSPEAWDDLGVGDQRLVRIGRKTDVWSLGCILYTFLYGKTPFQEYGNPMAKFRAITNPNHTIPFPKVKGVPQLLIESCRRCLIYDKDKRASIDQLLELKSQLLMTPPEVMEKLQPVLNNEAFAKAKAAIMDNDSENSVKKPM